MNGHLSGLVGNIVEVIRDEATLADRAVAMFVPPELYTLFAKLVAADCEGADFEVGLADSADS